MRAIRIAIAWIGILALSSCGTLNDTIDHGVDGGKEIVDHITEKVGEAKTEILEETKGLISALKTETIQEVEEAVDRPLPRLINAILNADGVAFLIVSVTVLLGIIVLVALYLLIGSVRAWWRMRARSQSV